MLTLKDKDLSHKVFYSYGKQMNFLHLNILMKAHNYFVYITTNPAKTVLYVGLTNDLSTRLMQHYENRGNKSSFAGRYFCYNLIYWERHGYINHAIEREKEIKHWRREKKVKLIEDFNPDWQFLNGTVT